MCIKKRELLRKILDFSRLINDFSMKWKQFKYLK